MSKHDLESDILHENFYGFISHCSCCDYLQLNFGNILMQLKINGFKTFLTALKNISSQNVNLTENQGIKELLIRTPQDGLFIKVDAEELESLIELLSTAIYMYEVKRMFAKC